MKSKISSWSKIGEGEYHVAYKSQKKHKGMTYVLKIPKFHDELSEPTRITRKWNLANPDLAATALNGPQIVWNIDDESPEKANITPNSIYLYCKKNQLKAIVKNSQGDVEKTDLSHLPDAQTIISLIEEDETYASLSLPLEHQIRRALKQPYRGMLAPYVDGTSIISEQKKAQALIQLYANTRQIVLDYDGEGNLISETKTGVVRCVDFDESICCNSPRRSRFFQNEDVHQNYRRLYIDSVKKIELGAQVNLSLVYLEKHLKEYLFPLETLNKYMTAEIIFALGDFESKSIPITMKTLDILFLLTHTYPDHHLHLPAESIHALEVNIDTMTAIEEICKALDERLSTGSEEQYLTSIEPEQFARFIEEKKGIASISTKL